MAVVDALNFPETSTFRDPDQVPLLDDPPVQARTGEGPFAKGEEEEEEREDIPNIWELALQIDSHIVVVDLENLASSTAFEDIGTSEVTLASIAPSSGGASPVLPDAAQDPSP